MSTDHRRFARLLEQLHKVENTLTPEQSQHLQFLDAVKNDMAGKTTLAMRQYQDILEQPLDPLTGIRARTALIALYLQQQKYVKAYSLANTLIAEMPRIKDRRVHLYALKILIRVSNSEQRYDQAIRYADQLEAMGGNDEYRCEARVFRTQAMLYRGDSTTSARADFRKAIDTCRSANLLGFANNLRLDWAELESEEGHPDQSIADLHRITPDVMRSGFRPSVATLQAFLSQAYLKKGAFARARRHALAALEASDPKDSNWTLQYVYRILYRIDKHDHHFSSALRMHEKYMQQYKASMADARAQALAYQMVRQDILSKKLRLEELGKQNRVLRLRQSLDRKSAETSHLYILLLLLVLAFIGFWAYRIKHSQVRFRRMARHDDLTGVLNRPYFFEQVENALLRLEKTGGEACFLILDMDHFKRVNDMYGHISGDKVLKHVTRICLQELRSEHIFGRMGGEEFGILIPDGSRTLGMEIGDRIRRALAATPVAVHEHTSVTITASIGLAHTALCGHALKALLIAADEALYAAKRSGRNKLILHKGHRAPAIT